MVFNRWADSSLLLRRSTSRLGWHLWKGPFEVDVYVYKVKYRLPYKESQESVGSEDVV